MKRRRVRSDVREALERQDREFAGRYGPLFPENDGAVGRMLLGRAGALAAGLPVIVRHGWEIDLEPDAGPFVLEPDGTLVDVVPVYAEPAARPRTVIGYRRPDGWPHAPGIVSAT